MPSPHNDPGETDFYAARLAEIHHADYTFAAHAASQVMAELLPRPGDCGPVVDLGCGSGALAQPLSRAGYQVIGVDVSGAMLTIAARTAPDVRLVNESLYDYQVPVGAAAVAAIGEVFNYRVGNYSLAAVQRSLRQIRSALSPAGFLLFDIAQPGRVPDGRVRTEVPLADGTNLLVEATESGQTLTRRIDIWSGTTLLSREVHNLQLFSDGDLRDLLDAADFAYEILPGYADFTPPVGWTPVLARPRSH